MFSDEADRMLDMGFVHDLKKSSEVTLRQKDKPFSFLSDFSGKEIQELAQFYARKNPVKVEVAPVSSTAQHVINQSIYL